MEYEKFYDLIVQNNASKEFFRYSGLTDHSTSHLYYEFELEMEVPEGEYTFAAYQNNRDDVEVEYKTPLLASILHTEDGDVLLRDLHPSTGLLRVGKPGQINEYDGGNSTNTVFYYDN